MARKARITLSVNEELLRWAKAYGINISRFLEARLEELRDLVEGKAHSFRSEEARKTGNKAKKKWRGRDSNPRPPDYESGALTC